MIGKDREINKPCDLVIGEELLHNHFEFGEPQITFDEIIDKIYNIEPKTLKEKEMYVKGFFLGDGTSGIYTYNNKKKYCWTLNNSDFNIIEKLKRYSDEIWNENLKIYDIRESSHVYRIASGKKDLLWNLMNFTLLKRKKEYLIIY